MQCGPACTTDISQQPLRSNRSERALIDVNDALFDAEKNILYVAGMSQTFSPLVMGIDVTNASIIYNYVGMFLNAVDLMLFDGGILIPIAYSMSLGVTSFMADNPKNETDTPVVTDGKIIAGVATSSSSLAVISTSWKNVTHFLQQLLVRPNNSIVITSDVTLELPLNVTPAAAFCLALYNGQYFAVFGNATENRTLLGFDANGTLTAQLALPVIPDTHWGPLRCFMRNSTLVLWAIDLPRVHMVDLDTLTLLSDLTLPYDYTYSVSLLGDTIVTSSCPWVEQDRANARTKDCALSWFYSNGSVQHVTPSWEQYALIESAKEGNYTWLVSNLVGAHSTVFDIIKLNAYFELELSYTVVLSQPALVRGLRAVSPRLTLVLVLNQSIGLLDVDVLQVSHSLMVIPLPDAFAYYSPLRMTQPLLLIDATSLYMAIFDKSLCLVKANWVEPYNTTVAILPKSSWPFLDQVEGDQDDTTLYLAMRENAWVVQKSDLSVLAAADLDISCGLLCLAYSAEEKHVFYLGATYSDVAADCVLLTTILSVPSLTKVSTQTYPNETIQQNIYLWHSAGRHYFGDKWYCTTSGGEVFKLSTANMSLQARYQIGGHLSNDPFSSSVQGNDSLYITQSSALWKAYLDCGEGYYRSKGECMPCLPGSVNPLQDTTACAPCPINMEPNPLRTRCLCASNYFTANASISCTPCPEGGICSGQNSLMAANGWWRVSSDEHNFYTCPHALACINNTCAKGYQDTVCAVCTKGYALWDTACKKCMLKKEAVPLWIGFAVLYLTFLVVLLLFGGHWSATMPTIKAVIALYQVFTSVPSYPLPAALAGIFVTVVGVAKLALLNVLPALSVDCLVGHHVPVPFMTIIYGASPICIVLLVVAVFGALSWCRSGTYSAKSDLFQEQNMLQQYERSGSIFRLSAFLLLLVYPPMCAALASFFVCRDIGGTWYLTEDYSLRCGSKQWFELLPGILTLIALYPLLAPVGLFLLLRFKRTQYDLSFLHGAYKDEYYWWDSLELTRKLLLFAQSAAWNGGQPTVALAISVCAMALQLQFQPFKNAFDQHLQTVGLLGVVLFYLWLSANDSDIRNGLAYATFVFVVLYTLMAASRILFAIFRSIKGRCTQRRSGATRVDPEEQHLLTARSLPTLTLR